jgi:menaquinone-9 beta-reductase
VRFGHVEAVLDLPRAGLGISRKALDAILANQEAVQRATVQDVRRGGGGFRLRIDGRDVSARVLVDAAGKLSRFTQRRAVNQFGIQFYEPGICGNVLDFWFFKDGYGGSVGVEGGRSNACFLVRKATLPRYLNKPNCLVTGPVAYVRMASEFLAIGDAAGMIDPFCGEGMRHALDTGRLAAKVVAEGLARGASYDDMRAKYENDRAARWNAKRRIAWMARELLKYPRLAAAGFGWRPLSLLGWMWE